MAKLFGHTHGRELEITPLQEAILIVVVGTKASSEPALEKIRQFGHAEIRTMAVSKVSTNRTARRGAASSNIDFDFHTVVDELLDEAFRISITGNETADELRVKRLQEAGAVALQELEVSANLGDAPLEFGDMLGASFDQYAVAHPFDPRLSPCLFA